MLLLYLQLLVLMFFLIVIGEPLRFLFLRRLRLFVDLDLPQICLLDVYLGGLVLYLIAILPLHLFSGPVVFGITVFGFFFSVSIYLKRFFRGEIGGVRVFLVEHKTTVLSYILLFTMFLVFLWIQLTPITTLVFGSIHDTSLHSLMVNVILENQHVPFTLHPYLPEGIVYPQASHVIFAYASYVLNYEAPKTVFYITPLFNALSVFGAYFLGKKLWSNRSFYLGLSFVFAFVSCWPLYITWGANPFITGFPLFLICLGLFFSSLSSHKKNDFKELIAVGVLTGYSAALILSYLETLFTIVALLSFYRYIRRGDSLRSTAKNFFIFFLVSLIPLSPFVSRFIIFYQYPGHNVGIASDFIGYEKFQPKLTQAWEWTIGNLNPHTILRIELIIIFFGFGILLWKVRGNKITKNILLFSIIILLASTILSFISFFLPADISIISWPHQSIIFSVPISIFIVIFYMKMIQFFHNLNLKLFSKVFTKRSYVVFSLSVIGLAVFNIPFVYYRLAVDPETLVNSYGIFAVTTEDDYELMQWMRVHLPSNAIVLVNPYEAGLFVPSTSHHKTVFPFVASQRAFKYQLLANLTSQNILNITTFELMRNYNITHIFLGTHNTYWWTGDHKWNPKLFLDNPNFKLIKRFNGSCLFELSYYDPKIVLLDEFDYEHLTDLGWKISSKGEGIGYAKITSLNGDNSLLINSTNKVGNNWDSIYSYELQITREVIINNISNVTLSFYINATSGFNQLDAVSIVVSNIWANRSICFATPNGVFQILDSNQTKTFTISFVDNSTYNLSKAWIQAFNTSLPNTILLQIRNYDIDGTPNIAFLDSIKIFQ